jgi:hypothetical protein
MMERKMRAFRLTAIAGTLLALSAGAAFADTVVIQPEQETVIREYVQKKPLASVKLPGVELNVGTALPDTVELHEVPDMKYRYSVVEDRTVVVDPDTRKVVHILK